MAQAMDVTVQAMEVPIADSEGASRLHIISGIGTFSLQAVSTDGEVRAETEDFVALVGPELTRSEFVRATAWAAPSGFVITPASAPDTDFGDHSVVITDVDADHDDESRRTQLRVGCVARAASGRTILHQVAFQVTVLATAAE